MSRNILIFKQKMLMDEQSMNAFRDIIMKQIQEGVVVVDDCVEVMLCKDVEVENGITG